MPIKWTLHEPARWEEKNYDCKKNSELYREAELYD